MALAYILTCQCVKDALVEKLRLNAFMANIPIGLEEKHIGIVDLITLKAYKNEGEDGEIITEIPVPADMVEQANEYRQIMIGKLADVDETKATHKIFKKKHTKKKRKKKSAKNRHQKEDDDDWISVDSAF